MIKQKNNAIESARNLLKDNQKALDALDVLEKKNKQYQKSKRHTHIMYLVAATIIVAYLYFAYQMGQNDYKNGIWLAVILGIISVVVVFLIAGIPQVTLDIDTTRMTNSTEINFINVLLAEHVTFKDHPLIKAGNHYYIDLPDGMREVSPENVPYDEDTKMIGREYRYKNLCWDSQGFTLQEITDVKVCNNHE